MCKCINCGTKLDLNCEGKNPAIKPTWFWDKKNKQWKHQDINKPTYFCYECANKRI